jgi:hypothetical protein
VDVHPESRNAAVLGMVTEADLPERLDRGDLPADGDWFGH